MDYKLFLASLTREQQARDRANNDAQETLLLDFLRAVNLVTALDASGTLRSLPKPTPMAKAATATDTLKGNTP